MNTTGSSGFTTISCGAITSSGGLFAGGAITGVTTLAASGNITAGTYNGVTVNTTGSSGFGNITAGTYNGVTVNTTGSSGFTTISCGAITSTGSSTIGGVTLNASNISTNGTITASTGSNTINNLGINNGTCTGVDFVATSDRRLKSDISTISNALDTVKGLRGVYFTRLGETTRSVGVIAQEVEEVLPEVVHGDEMKSVSYGNMVGLLIEAVKELAEKMKV